MSGLLMEWRSRLTEWSGDDLADSSRPLELGADDILRPADGSSWAEVLQVGDCASTAFGETTSRVGDTLPSLSLDEDDGGVGGRMKFPVAEHKSGIWIFMPHYRQEIH